ncbi:MAG: peptide-methionine (S)-S-oxide reductase [Flavobacteriales bacterium]|nr:peptide-methionine (S)-S-oxide reductase [Flavobacteriales bacterium]
MKKILSVLLILSFIQLKSQNNKEAYFASGCFWCVESIYESLIGVEKVESGYSGGNTKNPTYYSVLTGRTGHAESIKVYYDADQISFNELVKVFFGSHDPTTLNRQGPDRGTHYRSIAFFSTELEKKIINEEINRLLKNKTYPKIVTEVKRFEKFYIAEDYHQDYKENNPNNSYIWNVSVPRINKFKSKFSDILKKD